jgi:hypothetical protein
MARFSEKKIHLPPQQKPLYATNTSPAAVWLPGSGLVDLTGGRRVRKDDALVRMKQGKKESKSHKPY